MNDREREMWVLNHEPLYLAHKASRLSMRKFLRTQRAEIDAAIDAQLNPAKSGGLTPLPRHLQS